jgi:flagellar operon protein
MADRLNINERLLGTNGVGAVSPQTGTRPKTAASPGVPTFAELLQKATAQDGTNGGTALRFSAHAQTRIASRQIPMGSSELKRVEEAVQKAASKGARESLVLLDQTALVVSVPNRTVITVVDRDNLKSNVFTNIDSAVIA